MKHAERPNAMTPWRATLLLTAVATLAGCSLIFPGDEYDDGSEADGGGLAPLQGDAVLVRYSIAEAASGTAPAALLDSSLNNLDLFIDYQDDLEFGTRDCCRGLFWAAWGGDGLATADIGSTPLGTALGQAQQVTVELVVAVEEVPGVLLSISNGLTLSLTSARVEASWPTQGYSWQGIPSDGARRVLHLVVDTVASAPLTLRANGVALPVEVPGTIDPGAALPLASASSTLTVGNERDGTNSIGGGILYLAIYESALTPSQIDHNVARLLQSDDAP